MINKKTKTSNQIEAEILRVHNLFWESFAKRDIDLRFSLCSDDITMIGSGLHERAKNKDEYKKINEEGVRQFPDPFQIDFLWTNLTMLNENVACVESEVVCSKLINNEMSKELLRNTTLLKYVHYKWLVTHVHGSVPDYRLKDGDYMTNEQTIIRNIELEQQVFERTEELNKTLEELEQKNRELEIESALEKVRIIAMGMYRAEDLLNICEISFQEFQKLGLENLRNVIIHIRNDEKKFFMDYDYSEQLGGVITKIEYDSHPIVMDYVKQIRSAEDAYSEVVINKTQLEGWKDFRKKSGQKDDPLLDKVNALYYYLFSIGIGDIGISTLHPIDDSQRKILKRFRNVFDLAYRRYNDITLAEAQAREAKIQLALERVRARTMAMYKSEELSETSFVLFKQLEELGEEAAQLSILIYNEEERTIELYATIYGNQWEEIGRLPLDENSVHRTIYSAWKEKKKSIIIDLTGDELNEFNKFKMKHSTQYKSEADLPKNRWIIHNAFFSKGALTFSTHTPRSEETILLLERFANVFNLTYTRFLDLQKAEAQNKIIRAENDRKTKELEEARQLQLSLLSRSLPQLPQFDIAVYMKTATEVGGDYYDFNIQENGVLNVGFGDATGHGLQAGTMITLMKGFFTSDSTRLIPNKFLEHCNGMIRDIKLGRILMSFSHLRFENNRLLISSAGMPPVYYHHKKNNRTEEIIIQGLPLGAMRDASYKLVEKQLNSGDTILLITDGLPEQMNSHKVIFDYSRVLKYFDEIAEYAPKDIINRLVQIADEWIDQQPQEDDITFVVIRFL